MAMKEIEKEMERGRRREVERGVQWGPHFNWHLLRQRGNLSICVVADDTFAFAKRRVSKFMAITVDSWRMFVSMLLNRRSALLPATYVSNNNNNNNTTSSSSNSMLLSGSQPRCPPDASACRQLPSRRPSPSQAQSMLVETFIEINAAAVGCLWLLVSCSCSCACEK